MNATDTHATKVTMGGRTWTVTTYVDPCPGMKGDDKVRRVERCGRCGGVGRIEAFAFIEGGRCFGGHGAGSIIRYPRVSTLRRDARIDAVWREHGATMRAETAAKQAEVDAANAAAELAEAWDAAHREQARRAAMVTGFVAEVGDKFTGTGVVTVATTFEVPAYSGRGMDMKALVVVTLEDGRVVKAIGTGRTLYGVERGARVTITGTVKRHANYRGQDQTELTRTKIVGDAD